jgi:hypothetical protein
MTTRTLHRVIESVLTSDGAKNSSRQCRMVCRLPELSSRWPNQKQLTVKGLHFVQKPARPRSTHHLPISCGPPGR